MDPERRELVVLCWAGIGQAVLQVQRFERSQSTLSAPETAPVTGHPQWA